MLTGQDNMKVSHEIPHEACKRMRPVEVGLLDLMTNNPDTAALKQEVGKGPDTRL